ncbi:MAG: hypothetical protein QW835_00675 [Candidatus Hadarchaeum sp.]
MKSKIRLNLFFLSIKMGGKMKKNQMQKLPPGTVVGAGRWPPIGKPWKGIVLSQDDPRAWARTLAFPNRTPSEEEARQHVLWCKERGLLGPERVPVLWTFKSDLGGEYQIIYWETVGDGKHDVKPYEMDLELWQESNRRPSDENLEGFS